MDHLEAIVEIKNIISPDFIDKIIPLIDRKAKKKLAVLYGVDKSRRNVKGYHLKDTDIFYTGFIKKEIKKFKLGKGTILFFPSNFMYPHIIKTITKGTRYSIVSWLQ